MLVAVRVQYVRDALLGAVHLDHQRGLGGRQRLRHATQRTNLGALDVQLDNSRRRLTRRRKPAIQRDDGHGLQPLVP